MAGRSMSDLRFQVRPISIPAAVVPPRRRPVSDMIEVISGHEDEQIWTVQFRSTVFGVYCIRGPVHRSGVINELRIGLALITSGGQMPSRRVLNIWPGTAHLMDVEDDPCDPGLVRHGTPVRAEFLSHGDSLTIIGHAVSQRSNDLTGVGHHTIRSPSGISRHLQTLTRVRANAHNPPGAVYAWSDNDEDENTHRSAGS